MKTKSWSINTGLMLALAALLITTLALGSLGVAHAGSMTLSNTLLKETSEELFDRLNPNYNPYPVGPYWGYKIATSFSTGIGANTSYVLNSVTLRAYQEELNTTVQFAVYSNSGGVPGVLNGGIPGDLLGYLTSPGSFGNTYTSTALFTPSSEITLAADSYFWIVGTPVSGTLCWQASLDTAPDGNTGPGFIPAYALYGYPVPNEDGSPGPPVNNWYSSYGNVGEYMMKVEASAVPVPPSLLLLGSGLLSLLGLCRRKKI